jgi:hypothetical protein
MAIIRHKQRAVNSVIPQQGNKRFLKGASAGDFVPQPLARIIKVAGEECGCEYVGPDNTCLSRCLYEIRYSNYTNPPDSFTWGNTGGSVVLGGGPGDDFIVIETTSGDDVSIDLTCTVTDTVSSDTDDAAGTFIQKHTDTTQPVVFIGPEINDTSFVENVAISAFDFSVVFTGTITGYSLVGSWPPGVSIDNNGLLTGTPTGVAVYGGLQVQASGPGGTAVTNPFTVTITSAQAQSLVVSEVIAGECEYNSGLGESNCKATGEYTATPSGFSFPITSWVWEITSSTGGAPTIDTGQGTDTVEVSSTAGAQISVTLKCTASNGQGENASDLTQFFQKHDDVVVPIAWDGPDLGPYTWTKGTPVQIDYGARFSGTINGYNLLGTWPPGFTVSAAGLVEGTPTVLTSYGPIGVQAINDADSVNSNLTTADVNDVAPIFNGTIPNMTVENGQAMTPYPAANHFQTGGAVTLYAIALNPSWMSINSSTGEITGTADAEGTSSGIYVTGANSGGSDDSNAWQMEVTAAATNPPLFTGNIPDQTSTVGTPYSLNVSSQWTGGAATSYTISNNPAWLSITNAGVLEGTPNVEAVTNGIIATAHNADGSAASNAFQMDAQAPVVSEDRVMIINVM